MEKQNEKQISLGQFWCASKSVLQNKYLHFFYWNAKMLDFPFAFSKKTAHSLITFWKKKSQINLKYTTIYFANRKYEVSGVSNCKYPAGMVNTMQWHCSQNQCRVLTVDFWRETICEPSNKLTLHTNQFNICYGKKMSSFGYLMGMYTS